MKLYGVRSLVFASCMLPVAALAQETEHQQLGVSADVLEAVRDNYIFVLDSGVAPAEVRGRANALMARHGGRLGHVYTSSIRGFSAKMPAKAAARLAAETAEVAYYEADQPAFLFQGRPGGGGGGGGTPQVTPAGIARVGGPMDATGLTAWIIDTGIDLDHPDLNVDVERSRNFVSRGRDTPNDGNGHGSHVAGTLGAIDNDIAVVGVAANATLVAIRVLDNSGSGSFADVIAGVDHVGANGAPGDVANMSLGGGFSQAVNDAVIAASSRGIFFSIAAGNSSADSANFSPASAEGQFIYTVSAMNMNDVLASFSNFGNPPVDCAAPGVGVLSTWNDGGTNTISGTSMAAPHVGGILLVNGGVANSGGHVTGDPDGMPDMICVK